MKRVLLASFLILLAAVTGCAQDEPDPTQDPVPGEAASFVRLGQLRWAPGALNNTSWSYFANSNPATITHTLELRSPANPAKRVVLGFNSEGGGYGWSARMYGFDGVPEGKETGANGYGRGMLGSIRDRMHHGMYNPIQSGRHYDIGVPTKVIARPTYIWVPQFQAPLFDDQEFDELTNNKSEFDFSALTENVTPTFGIPAFSHQEYYVWARVPDAMNQFLSGTIDRGPYNGQAILDGSLRIRDISGYPDVQTPRDTDMSYLSHTLKGLRPPLEFKYLWYRSNGAWVVIEIDPGARNRRGRQCRYPVSEGRSYAFESGAPVPIPKAGCRLDYPFFVLSTSPSPNEGSAQGLYIPTKDPMNGLQSKIISTNPMSVVHQEDRRLRFVFLVAAPRRASRKGDAFQLMVARAFTTGMLSPATTATLYGPNTYEALTQKSIVLYGTTQEIFDAVRRHHDGLPQ